MQYKNVYTLEISWQLDALVSQCFCAFTQKGKNMTLKF